MWDALFCWQTLRECNWIRHTGEGGDAGHSWWRCWWERGVSQARMEYAPTCALPGFNLCVEHFCEACESNELKPFSRLSALIIRNIGYRLLSHFSFWEQKEIWCWRYSTSLPLSCTICFTFFLAASERFEVSAWIRSEFSVRISSIRFRLWSRSPADLQIVRGSLLVLG